MSGRDILQTADNMMEELARHGNLIIDVGSAGTNTVSYLRNKGISDVCCLGMGHEFDQITTKGLSSDTDGLFRWVGYARLKKKPTINTEAIEELLVDAERVGLISGLGRRGGEVLPEFARFLLGERLKISAYVFTPFNFEGINAMWSAENCIAELTELGIETHIYPNQDTYAEADEGTTFAEAFALQSEKVFSMISDW